MCQIWFCMKGCFQPLPNWIFFLFWLSVVGAFDPKPNTMDCMAFCSRPLLRLSLTKPKLLYWIEGETDFQICPRPTHRTIQKVNDFSCGYSVSLHSSRSLWLSRSPTPDQKRDGLKVYGVTRCGRCLHSSSLHPEPMVYRYKYGIIPFMAATFRLMMSKF